MVWTCSGSWNDLPSTTVPDSWPDHAPWHFRIGCAASTDDRSSRALVAGCGKRIIAPTTFVTGGLGSREGCGFAEGDTDDDLSGNDAARKIRIPARHAFGQQATVGELQRLDESLARGRLRPSA
jgi:Homoserine dehydrogenase